MDPQSPALPITWATGLLYEPLRKASGEYTTRGRSRSRSQEQIPTHFKIGNIHTPDDTRRQKRNSTNSDQDLGFRSLDPRLFGNYLGLSWEEEGVLKNRAHSNVEDGSKSACLSAELWASWVSLAPTSSNLQEHLTPELAELSFLMSSRYFLDHVLRDTHARKAFMVFLQGRRCHENLMFWLDVERYVNLDSTKIWEKQERAKFIHDKFLRPDSPFPINISSEVMEQTIEKIEQGDPSAFEAAQKAVFLIMLHDTFEYFLKEERYEFLKRNAPKDFEPMRDIDVVQAGGNNSPRTGEGEQKGKKKRRNLTYDTASKDKGKCTVS